MWELPPLPESPILHDTVPTLRQTLISPIKTNNDKESKSPRKFGHHRTTSKQMPTSPDKVVNVSPPKRHDYDHSAQTYQTQQSLGDQYQQEVEPRSRGFPISSPRKPTSPTKVPLPPSPTYGSHEGYLSPHRPRVATGRDSAMGMGIGDASFMFPSNMSDSLIGETSMPTMMMDHSLDFGMDSVRACLPREQDMGYNDKKCHGDKDAEGSVTPTRVIKGSMTPTGTTRRPVPTTVIRETRAVAPATVQRINSNRERISPSKTPSNRMGLASYPSASTLASVHQTLPRQKRHADLLDVSTLLPSSPARTAHLLSDKHQLLRESLPSSECEGDESFFLPPMPTTVRKSPRKPNARAADMTMDINDLMAKMSKPKRPSGTEESFEDLLNAPGFELDQSIMGNEPFLPPDLRPSNNRLRQSPVKHTPARIRNAPQLDTGLPPTSPVRREASRSSPLKQEIHAPNSNTRMSAFASPRRPVPSPTRPISHATLTSATPRLASTTREAGVLASSPRRPPQPTLGNRRVSLSTGALPLPSSASQPRLGSMPRPGHGRSGSTAASIATTTVTRSTGLERTASSRVTSPPKPTTMGQPARSVVPRPPQSRTGSTATVAASTASTTGVPQKSRIGSTTSRTTVAPSISRPASFRPSSQTIPAKSSLTPSLARPTTTTTTRPTTNTSTAKSSLPQPGTGSSARSALTRPGGSTTSSRAFGTDGSATTNRLSARPGTSATASASIARLTSGKMSMAPPALPAKRETTTSTLKSRATSTPAHVALTRGLSRPTTTSTTASSKSSIPPPTNSKSSTTTRSTLPRPPTSRLPATAGTGASLSRLPSAASRNSANITALRARIDALSARQADTRR